VAGGGHAEAARVQLAGMGVTDVGPADKIRRIGRAVLPRTPAVSGAPEMTELCGRCGRGRAAVSPEGDVWPCVLSRWMTAGSVRTQRLAEILSGQRMRDLVAAIHATPAPCNPNCKPSLGDGNDCGPAEKPACGPSYCKPDLGEDK
jgi:Iron-sulfur cluster-binding domain